MKIALCLSGYLRTFEECYPSILKNVIQDNDVDIFIHTYDKKGMSKGWINDETNEILKEPIVNNPANEGYREFRPKLVDKINMEFLENLNIKSMVVEKLDNIYYKFSDLIGKVSIFSNIDEMAIILYKIYMCNQLKIEYEKQNNFKYDLVIRTRGDQMFTKKIDYNFPKEKILINAYPWGDEDFVSNTGVDEECISDRFAVGSSQNIDYLCNLYIHYKEIFAVNHIHYSPIEHLFYYHLKDRIELEKRNLGFYVKHNPPRYKKY